MWIKPFKGAMTLSRMTLSQTSDKMKLSRNMTLHFGECHSYDLRLAECHGDF